jgi:hypothetical protein
MDWLQSGTVKALLQVCVESAQQTLRILSNLLDQGLLGWFPLIDFFERKTNEELLHY